MSIELVTSERAGGFGRFVGVPLRAELDRFFFLDDLDRDVVGVRRRVHNRLGFAVQLGTVRFLGVFLADPTDVPWGVVEYVADQLGVDDPSVVKRYAADRPSTAWEHAGEIRDRFGYVGYGDEPQATEFEQFLAGRAWTQIEGPLALFDHAAAWLRRHRVLLPGVSVLARDVVEARTAAANRLHRDVVAAAERSDRDLSRRLVGLLGGGDERPELERLRRSQRRVSGKAMTRSLQRAAEVLAVGAHEVRLDSIPPNRVGWLARYGLTAQTPTLRALVEPRRTATLTAAVARLAADAVDDALDLFDALMSQSLIGPARRRANEARLGCDEDRCRILNEAARAAARDADAGPVWAPPIEHWAARSQVPIPDGSTAHWT